jgi:hypothetical protein
VSTTKTDGGEDVQSMSDAVLRVRYDQAWRLSNTHDLRVLADEARRRGLAWGATASPVDGALGHTGGVAENPRRRTFAEYANEVRKHLVKHGMSSGQADVNVQNFGAHIQQAFDDGEPAVEMAERIEEGGGYWKGATSNPLPVGRGTFTQHLKLHHYTGSLRITDLQNAGKRGKKVKQLSVMPRTLDDAAADAVIERVADAITQQDMTYAQAVDYLEAAGKDEYQLEEQALRGVDVEPAGVTIQLEKKFDDGSIVRVDASPHDFHVVSSVPIVAPGKAANGYRQDTLYYPKAKADGIAFYAWLKDHVAKAASMTIQDLTKVWDSLDIAYYYH